MRSAMKRRGLCFVTRANYIHGVIGKVSELTRPRGGNRILRHDGLRPKPHDWEFDPKAGKRRILCRCYPRGEEKGGPRPRGGGGGGGGGGGVGGGGGLEEGGGGPTEPIGGSCFS